MEDTSEHNSHAHSRVHTKGFGGTWWQRREGCEALGLLKQHNPISVRDHGDVGWPEGLQHGGIAVVHSP